ncbi:hypothetical protein [Pandoraea sp. CB10b_02]|uniref:DUF7666 domain-containing protein n=1 Tax=Pandoraea sp. CB10b_02 TaxID=2014535 RepID=UPI0025805D3E|nr:hypothetical protein [Pandoraea sp. CB10b_02]
MLNESVLVIRTSDKNRKAYNGFQWPESGLVECPDWNPRAECGNGLHGILWPEGNWSDIKDYGGDETWQVVKVAKSDLIEIGGKVKFPKGEVVYSGTFAVAFNMVAKKWLDQMPAWTKAIQDEAKVELKDGEVDSGNSARIGSSGNSAQIGSSGDSAQIGSSGDYAQIGSSGYSAQIGSSGDYAQIGSSGDYAQIDVAGEKAVIACAGSVERFKAGANGCIAAPWWDEKSERTRFAVGYVGENIKADTWYTVNESGEFVEIEQ